jgi:hypothetical protein
MEISGVASRFEVLPRMDSRFLNIYLAAATILGFLNFTTKYYTYYSGEHFTLILPTRGNNRDATQVLVEASSLCFLCIPLFTSLA